MEEFGFLQGTPPFGFVPSLLSKSPWRYTGREDVEGLEEEELEGLGDLGSTGPDMG